MDHSSHEQFYEYYARASQQNETIQRFRSIRDSALRILRRDRPKIPKLEVADVGCGAGTQSILWAELGHRVHGLDINAPLLELARERAVRQGYPIEFKVGTTVAMPWADGSMDVCLVIELLEHVVEWRKCLDECTRVLRPGGVLFLTTTNRLCPIQHEFNLPLYSWYPRRTKRHFEHVAVTSRPDLANHAKYPAVNWFTFFELRDVLAGRGFRCLDRFDAMELAGRGLVVRTVVNALRTFNGLRWLAHVATPGTILIAIKNDSGRAT